MKRFVYVKPAAGVAPEFVALMPSGYTPLFCADAESHTASASVTTRSERLARRLTGSLERMHVSSPRAGNRPSRRSRDVALAGQVAERLEPRQEEVRSTPDGRERRHSGD